MSIVRVGVGVLTMRSGKVLLGKRNSDPAKADSELHGEDTWTLPGGKMEFKESFEETARREVREETTLEADDFELVSITNDIDEDAHFITIGLKPNILKGEPKITEPDEITEWKWFDINNLPSKMFPPAEKIIKNFLEKKIYKY